MTARNASALPAVCLLHAQKGDAAFATTPTHWQASSFGCAAAAALQGLDPLVSALGGDLTALGSSVNDVFATSVLNTKITLEQLQNGQQLTASNGNTVTVTVTT